MLSDELFDKVLPLPFRIVFLLVTGSWLWLAVLSLLDSAGLQLHILFKLQPQQPQQQNQQQTRSLFKSHQSATELASIVSIVTYLIYTVSNTSGSLSFVDFIPLSTILFIFFFTFSARFKTTLFRVLRGKIDLTIRTNDIILSDSLLSYSKVGVDILVYVLHLLNFQTTYQVDNKIMINRSLGEKWNLGHLILLYPVIIRMLQCFYEYRLTGKKTQFYNLNKYLTTALIILTSLLLPDYIRLLFILQLISSLYSFFWDVTIDWEFNVFTNLINGSNKTNTTPLRANLLLFKNQSIYYFIIVVNFLIKFSWLLRYTAGPGSFLSLEVGLFSVELLELLRRFLWILLKLDVDFGKLDEFELSTYHES